MLAMDMIQLVVWFMALFAAYSLRIDVQKPLSLIEAYSVKSCMSTAFTSPKWDRRTAIETTQSQAVLTSLQDRYRDQL